MDSFELTSLMFSYIEFVILTLCCSVLLGVKMAFLNKIGNILKHSVGKNTNLELSASNASLFQAIRSMSSSKIFVGGEQIFSV